MINLTVAALAALAVLPMDRITGRSFATRSEVLATHGMAATSHPLATQVALDILKGTPVPQRVEVPVQVVLPRGFETPSVRADIWAELHVAWDMTGDTILSQGPAPSAARQSQERA